jgi:pimeloyl-ACP methyl ester carboxylesterase
MFPVRQWYGPKPTPDEHHFVDAADGWRLAMHRYLPRGKKPHGAPVLLQHGLGTCSMQFDLGVGTEEHPAPSLAHWLADRGFDVWACDLRGSGASLRPAEHAAYRWDWSVDDFILQDGPAFVGYILQTTGRSQLHWVGHSLGGILLLCHCIVYGSQRIASGVVASAGLDYSGSASAYDLIEPLKHLGRLVRRVPAGLFGRQVAPLFGRWQTRLEASFFHPANIAPAAARAVACNQYDIAGETLFQLASLFKTGGLTSRDGKRYAERIAEIELPLLFMAGERDLQCSPEVVERNYAMLGGEHNRLMVFGKRHGHVEDYGHFDLFSGLRADSEVFPHVHAWLTAASTFGGAASHAGQAARRSEAVA